MEKTFKIKKKIVAIIMLIITVFGANAQVFAAEGEGTWTGMQYPSYYITTDTSQTIGICLRSLTNVNTGEQITAFCAEHGKEFYSGVKESGEYYTPTSYEMKKACKIAYLGWYSKYGSYVVNEEVVGNAYEELRKDYAFTQQFIWEVLGQTSATFINSTTQAQYEQFKSDIESQLNAIEQKPSFNESTVELDAGETKTINDENGVLSEYKSIDTTIDGVRIIHNEGENTLTLMASEDCDSESISISESVAKSIGLIKSGTEDNDTTIYFDITDDDTQDQLYSLHYNDTVALEINLKVNLFGNIELSKVNENNQLIDGSVFTVTDNDDYTEDIVVENGKIEIENLPVGTYYVKEKAAPEGFLIDTDEYEVKVTANKTATVTIVNSQPKGKLIVNKEIVYAEDSDTCLVNVEDFSEIQFRLTAGEDIVDKTDDSIIYEEGQEIGVYNLNQDGALTINDLPMGKYNLQEVQTIDGLALDQTVYEVEFTKVDDTTKIYTVTEEISNSTTLVEISKKDITGEEELEGATLTVFDENENIIDTWISTDEAHKIEGLTAGKTYTLREEIAPEGYTIATDIQFEVNDTEILQKVVMVDKIVEISKQDITTGEELEGAKMQITDEEGNIIDEWVSTTEPHKVSGLEENKTYTLTEITAPEGYEIAESIEFTVSWDKATQTIVMKDQAIIDTPKTGVKRKTIFYVGSFIVCATCLAILVIKRKNKKEQNNE